MPISMGFIHKLRFLQFISITSSRISSFWIFSGLRRPIFEIFLSSCSAQQEASNDAHINRFWWRQYILSVIFQKSNMFDNSVIRGYFLTKHSCHNGTCDADSDEKNFFWKFSKFRSLSPLYIFFTFFTFFTPTQKWPQTEIRSLGLIFDA